jgi:hypothetical protein
MLGPMARGIRRAFGAVEIGCVGNSPVSGRESLTEPGFDFDPQS